MPNTPDKLMEGNHFKHVQDRQNQTKEHKSKATANVVSNRDVPFENNRF